MLLGELGNVEPFSEKTLQEIEKGCIEKLDDLYKKKDLDLENISYNLGAPTISKLIDGAVVLEYAPEISYTKRGAEDIILKDICHFVAYPETK